MHWVPRRQVRTLGAFMRFTGLTALYLYSNALAINAAHIVWAFNIRKCTDSYGNQVTPDPNALLDEGLAVYVSETFALDTCSRGSQAAHAVRLCLGAALRHGRANAQQRSQLISHYANQGSYGLSRSCDDDLAAL